MVKLAGGASPDRDKHDTFRRIEGLALSSTSTRDEIRANGIRRALLICLVVLILGFPTCVTLFWLAIFGFIRIVEPEHILTVMFFGTMCHSCPLHMRSSQPRWSAIS